MPNLITLFGIPQTASSLYFVAFLAANRGQIIPYKLSENEGLLSLYLQNKRAE